MLVNVLPMKLFIGTMVYLNVFQLVVVEKFGNVLKLLLNLLALPAQSMEIMCSFHSILVFVTMVMIILAFLIIASVHHPNAKFGLDHVNKHFVSNPLNALKTLIVCQMIVSFQLVNGWELVLNLNF